MQMTRRAERSALFVLDSYINRIRKPKHFEIPYIFYRKHFEIPYTFREKHFEIPTFFVILLNHYEFSSLEHGRNK